MYSREEIKQLHKEFWTAFGTFCQHLPRFKYRHKDWILYNTRIKGVEMKFDATCDGAYVIMELNNKSERKRLAMMELLKRYKAVVDEDFADAVWEDSYIKPCGTEVCRIYRCQSELNIHKKEQWKDFFVYLSKNMSALERVFDAMKEQLQYIATDSNTESTEEEESLS